VFSDFPFYCFLVGEMSVLESHYNKGFSCGWVSRFTVGYSFFFVSLRFKSVHYSLATGCCTISLVFFFSLHCLSCYLCLVCFLMYFLGGVVSFRFYQFIGVACVAYFALNLLPFATVRLFLLLRLADVCAILLLGCF
jgi:hypothetical protein